MKKAMLGLMSLILAVSLLAGCNTLPVGDTKDESQAKTSSESTKESSTEPSLTEEPESEPSSEETAPSDNYPSGNWEMSTEGTVEETVIYDEDGIKITVTGLKYSNSRVEVGLLLENNRDKKCSITSNTIGYDCNAVNGYMIPDGYVNEDIAPGKKANTSARFNYDVLLQYGITEIADIELGFTITDEAYHSIYTDPLKIETSLAASHDYEKDEYQEGICSLAAMKALGYNVLFFDTQKLYDEGGVTLLSECVIEERYGEKTLYMEFENATDEMLYVGAENISINDLIVLPLTWTTDAISGNHKGIMKIQLDRVLSETVGEAFGIHTIGNVGMEITLDDVDRNEIEEPKKISISWDEGATYDKNGDELYNNHNVRIISKGYRQDDSDWSPDIHIYMLVENNRSERITVEEEYGSLSINDFMVSSGFGYVGLDPGEAGILEITLYSRSFEDAGIETISDIKKAESSLRIRNGHYSTIDEPVITFGPAE